METKNLVQLIRELKPRAALFTTYTLSLSFFESVLLPVLRQVGCHDIAILVDANEAVHSISEAHVNYAGRRYWIAPVVAPGGGVFHPKLTYLVSSDIDVLVVGSGNLTLPGQSGQLETLDAVSSKAAPSVFKQFEIIANNLANKIEHNSWHAANLLHEFGIRASLVAAKSIDFELDFPASPMLISSVNRPANEQIIELWRKKNLVADAQALTVLSPFHAPDGAPIVRLAQSFRAEQVAIGLDPKTLVAPFNKKLFKENNVSYVVPNVEGEVRCLHGKVFEVIGPNGALIITGSINATNQSLESVKNIEVSLARWLPSPCFSWNKVNPERFEPNDYSFKERQPNLTFLEAALDPNGIIRGRLVCVKKTPIIATVNILRSDVPVVGQSRDIAIEKDGEFSFGPISELTTDGALQLEITFLSVRATCWLNIEEELASSDEERRGRQSIRHILRGDFKSEDVMSVLHILCKAASFKPAKTSIPTIVDTEPKITVDSGYGNRPFSYLQWQMSGHVNHKRGLLGIHYDATLRAFIRWLNMCSGLRT